MWVRIDDNFPDHPKLASLGVWAPLAGWLHICAICYCNRYLTDGFIPAAMLARLTRFDSISVDEAPSTAIVSWGSFVEVEEVANALCSARLWDKSDDGYSIHDYLDYQPSKDDIEAKRTAEHEKRSSAGKRRAASAARDEDGRFSAGQNQQDQESSSPNPIPIEKEHTCKHVKEFEEFWKEYPRKRAKKPAGKAFDSALKRGISVEQLMVGARNYAASVVDTDERYVCLPSTFLNQDRYEDFQEAPVDKDHQDLLDAYKAWF